MYVAGSLRGNVAHDAMSLMGSRRSGIASRGWSAPRVYTHSLAANRLQGGGRSLLRPTTPFSCIFSSGIEVCGPLTRFARHGARQPKKTTLRSVFFGLSTLPAVTHLSVPHSCDEPKSNPRGKKKQRIRVSEASDDPLFLATRERSERGATI